MAKPTASEGDFPTSYEQYQAGNWPYEVVPKDPTEHDDAITWQGLHEFAFKSEEGDVYAGCYPRAMINNAANMDQPLMIGASDRGNRSVESSMTNATGTSSVAGRQGPGRLSRRRTLSSRTHSPGTACV